MENEQIIRGRIEQIRDIYKWTENSLANNPATQKRLNRQLSHNATITVETLLLILDACPGVSAEWLLRGRGEMIVEDPGDSLADTFSHNKGDRIGVHNDSEVIQRFLSMLEEKDRQIDRLLHIISKADCQLITGKD